VIVGVEQWWKFERIQRRTCCSEPLYCTMIGGVEQWWIVERIQR
jgi:hypothetical protein